MLNIPVFSTYFEELGGPEIFFHLMMEISNANAKDSILINEFCSIIFDLLIRKQNSTRIIQSIIEKQSDYNLYFNEKSMKIYFNLLTSLLQTVELTIDNNVIFDWLL